MVVGVEKGHVGPASLSSGPQREGMEWRDPKSKIRKVKDKVKQRTQSKELSLQY